MNLNTRKAIVTGATGYVGSNFVKQLLLDKWDVICIVRNAVKLASFSWRMDVGVIVYDGTFRSLIDHPIFVDNHAVVFHLASMASYDCSSDEIGEMITSNITFGTHLLQAMSFWKIRNIINTGTYWQFDYKGKYHPTCLYAATKQAYEKIIELYVFTKMFSCITLYVFDIYGPFDFRKKLLNLFEQAVKSGDCLKLTPGMQEIELVYITDVVKAFIIAAKKLTERKNISGFVERYAISSRNRVTLRMLARLYEEIYATKLAIEWGAVPYRESTIMQPWLPDDKEILEGWSPVVNVKEGLNLIKEAHQLIGS